MALFSCYSGLARQDIIFDEYGFQRYFKENGLQKQLSNLSSIQRSDQKIWAFLAVIPVLRDKTSSLPSRDSIGTSRKMGYGNNCKTLSGIQRSDQKLWPFSAVLPVWRDKTSSSPSRDSIGSSRKTGSQTAVKLLKRSTSRINSYGPFQLLFRSGATRPAVQRVGIP